MISMSKANISVDNSDLSNKLPSFIVGEFGFYINITLIEEDSTAIDLTSKTIKFQTKNINSVTKKIDASCSIVDATKGQCKYLVKETDMDEIGIFEAEVEIQISSTLTRKINLGTFAVFSDV